MEAKETEKMLLVIRTDAFPVDETINHAQGLGDEGNITEAER